MLHKLVNYSGSFQIYYSGSWHIIIDDTVFNISSESKLMKNYLSVRFSDTNFKYINFNKAKIVENYNFGKIEMISGIIHGKSYMYIKNYGFLFVNDLDTNEVIKLMKIVDPSFVFTTKGEIRNSIEMIS